MERFSRYLIVGTSGSGKTTIAKKLSTQTGIPVCEIDALYHQPGWKPAPDAAVRAALKNICEKQSWIIDGNYTHYTFDIAWPHAEVLVWIDFPILLVLFQITGRTISRLITRKELWNGNTETFRNFFSKENMIIWAWQTHSANRKKYSAIGKKFPALNVVRLRTRGEVKTFLSEA